MELNHASKFKRLSGFLLLALALSLIWTQSARAQSQDTQKPDVQQLKAKLEQLEQMMNDLKGQISVMEGAPKTPVSGISAEKPTAETYGGQTTVSKPEESQKPKSTALTFYGFAMADTGYNFGETDPNWFDTLRPTKLDSFPGQFAPADQVYFSVRQSRFGVKSTTSTIFGDLKTIFEFDMYGVGVDAGQTTIRLRHAWGELKHIGGGQTNSTFMDIDVFPNVLDYWGPNGMVFFRNVQVRWMPIAGDSHLWFALERPGSSGDAGVYADRIELQNISPRDAWPDLTMQARLARNWGHVQIAGIFRDIRWVDTLPGATNFSGSAFGAGVNVSSVIKFTQKDTGRFSVVYGHGIENYMNDAPIDIGAQTNPGNAVSPIKGVALPVLGIVSYLDHTWSDRFTSAIGYSMVNITNSNAELPSDFHQGYYASANLLYYPVKSVMMGGEFLYGRRVDFSSGFNVNDYRLQFSFKYDWSKGFEF